MKNPNDPTGMFANMDEIVFVLLRNDSTRWADDNGYNEWEHTRPDWFTAVRKGERINWRFRYAHWMVDYPSTVVACAFLRDNGYSYQLLTSVAPENPGATVIVTDYWPPDLPQPTPTRPATPDGPPRASRARAVRTAPGIIQLTANGGVCEMDDVAALDLALDLLASTRVLGLHDDPALRTWADRAEEWVAAERGHHPGTFADRQLAGGSRPGM